MKRGRFSEEPIVRILNGHEAGRKIGELVRQHDASEATLYGCRSNTCAVFTTRTAGESVDCRSKPGQRCAEGVVIQQRPIPRIDPF